MKKKYFFASIIFLILVIGILDMGVGGFNDSKIESKIFDELKEKNEVKVIVELKEDSELPSEFKGRSIGTLREQIINSISKEKVKHRFSRFSGFSATLTGDEIEKLRLDKRVKKVYYDWPFHISLQNSAIIVNATTTWPIQINGINITGEGETICVIDTGVNYSHSDLGGCYGNNNASSSCKVLGGYDFVNDNADPYDDHGHGTHVTGIVSANGGIKGVAPETKIIAIKVLDFNGYGSGSDIAAGIEWCINNASQFNISVISMSLGCNTTADGYKSYCDSSLGCSNSVMASRINDAVGENISVIVATGNDGWTDAMQSPACIENATAVGWSNKDDTINTNSNRNNITDLFAPGTDINSTWKDGGYLPSQGTSMSTPHVSAAFALVRQYCRLQNGRILTPAEIQDALNDTGETIYDSGSGLNFSRINIYPSILSLDETAPNITLVSPSNGMISFNVNQTFVCNMTDLQLKNMTFYLWNSTGDEINSSIKDISGTTNQTEFNITNLNYDTYDWTCFACDLENNCDYASSNFSLTITNIAVTLVSPADNLHTKQNQTFTCNATSTQDLSNVTFYLWNLTGSEVNSSTKDISGTENSTTFDYNFTYEDDYRWNCLFVNNLSSENFASSNFSVTYDLTSPILNVTSPENNSWYNAGRFNISLNEDGTCWYSLNEGANNVSMDTADNQNFGHINSSLDEEEYNVTFYCNDTADNENLSALIFFNIDKSKPNITLISPIDGYSATGTQTINFQFNVSDNLNITECDLILNNGVAASNSSQIINNSINTISYSVSPGTYSWQINCTDQAGNENNSEARTFTINSPVYTPSGGGGGVSSQTYSPTQEQTSTGYTEELRNNDKIKFKIFDEKAAQHILTLDYIGKDFVNLTIQSEIINLVLGIGQSAKLNLTSPDYYDLYIKLEEVVYNKAKLTIQTIHDPIIREIVKVEENVTFGAAGEEEPEEKPDYWDYIIAISLILAITVILVIYVLKSKKKSK